PAGSAVRGGVARPATVRPLRARDARRARTPGMDRVDAHAILPGAKPRMMSVDPTTVLGAALDALVEPVLVTDAQGRLTFANATAARVLGAARDIGHPVSDLLERLPARTPDGGRLTPALHPIRRALAQGEALIAAERLPSYRALRGETVSAMTVLIAVADGTTRRTEVSAHPLRRDGAIYATVVTWHDVTEQTRALADLEAARAAAEEANQLKDDFI